MDTQQFDTLTMWVGILALASIVEILAMATFAVLGYRLYTKSRQTLEDLERRHVEPLTRQMSSVLDSVSIEVARVRHGADRVERAAEAITGGISSAALSFKQAVLPGYAATRGVLAAVSAFRRGGVRARERQLTRLDNGYETNQLMNEGGNNARTEQL